MEDVVRTKERVFALFPGLDPGSIVRVSKNSFDGPPKGKRFLVRYLQANPLSNDRSLNPTAELVPCKKNGEPYSNARSIRCSLFYLEPDA